MDPRGFTYKNKYLKLYVKDQVVIKITYALIRLFLQIFNYYSKEKALKLISLNLLAKTALRLPNVVNYCVFYYILYTKVGEGSSTTTVDERGADLTNLVQNFTSGSL